MGCRGAFFMRNRRIEIYVSVMVAGAIGSLAWLVTREWAAVRALLPDDIWGFSVLLLLGLAAETMTLSITIGRKSGSTSSIIFLPMLASLLLFGPAPTVLLMGISGLVGEFLIRKKEAIKATFNSAQYVVAATAAGWLFGELGGIPLALKHSVISEVILTQAIAFAGFGFAFVILNNAAVTFAVALSEGLAVRKVWTRIIGGTGTNLLYDLGVSPIAIAVALLYLELGSKGIVLVIFPLFFIRAAYSSNVKLQQANRDLLTALVKAIETRDPYTSGHSLRVASLAVRIADALGLSSRKQKDIETAALLHDIGKIEAVYTEILGKPEDLTPEEREIIQSHVLKGVELLEQISSFSKDVIAGVKGHHERIDGKGYPQGLRGNEIPLAARIIKVCDAIDAMLSDRAYRKALSLPQVREQLIIYSGIQFDVEVVKAAIEGDLLEAHRAEIQLQRNEGYNNIRREVRWVSSDDGSVFRSKTDLRHPSGDPS